ncbi:MAG: tetratricopeptide repeat protein [Porticoccaceae bacterium]|nr:tetratricopeptide repeat protein [Porticoccaceae bacterium]
MASIDTAVKLSKAALKSPDEETAALLFNQGLLAQQASRTDAAQAALNESIDSYLALNSTGKGNLWQAVLVQAQILGITSPDQALARLNEAMAGFPGQADFSQQPGEVAYADLAFLAGRLYFEQQRFDQAVTILEQALQHLTTTDQQQPLLDVLGLLASSYDRTEQAEQATIVRSRILRLQAQRPATMNSVMHLNELAMRHQHDQEYALAAQYYQQALTRLSELGQEESIEQALILGNFAGVRLAEEDNQSALMLFEKSYALHKRLDQRRIEAAAVAGYIGTLYYRLRQYHNAEPVFLQALAWLDDTPEAGPESLLIALENLVALYKVWGRDSQARRFELRARELKDQRNH